MLNLRKCFIFFIISGLANTMFAASLQSLEKALAPDSENKVQVAGETLPQLIKGAFPGKASLNKKAVATSFIEGLQQKQLVTKPGFRTQTSKRQPVKFFREEHDPLKKHSIIRVRQQINGIPIFGSDLKVHIDAQNTVRLVSGKVYEVEDLDTRPSISKQQAIVRAEAALAKERLGNKTISDPVLTIYSEGTLSILAWHVVIRATRPWAEWHCLVDAKQGKLLFKYNNLKSKGRKHWQTHKLRFYEALPGILAIENDQSTTNTTIQTLHDHVSQTYDYFKNTHFINSYDNNFKVVTASAVIDNRFDYVNAFWNGQQMVFGNGSPQQGLRPLGDALDVVAHEFGHAVTDYTADLIYRNQSGALNESYSDIWGAMLDRDDWTLGEDLALTSTADTVIRDMADPARKDQPIHMDGYRDDGSVHFNSGIVNRAFYLVATKIGKEKAETIYFRALMVYLTQNTDFLGARIFLEQSAKDIYGPESAEFEAIVQAFETVGIKPLPNLTESFPKTFVSQPYATPHPYSNKERYTKTFKHTGARAMKLKFRNFNVENYYDRVFITDGKNRVFYTYTGSRGNFETGPVPGDTIIVHFQTDASVTRYGFDIDGYYYQSNQRDTNRDPISAFRAHGGDKQVQLTWRLPTSNVHSVSLFRTRYGRTTSADYQTVFLNSRGVSYLDTGLSNNATYLYKMITHYPNNYVTTASYVSATTKDTVAPSPIKNFEFKYASGNFTLSWQNPSDGFKKVRLVKSTNGVAEAPEDGVLVTENRKMNFQFSKSQLSPMTAYYYTLFVQDLAGNWSPPTAVNIDTIPPESPDLLQVAVQNGTGVLVWSPVESPDVRVRLLRHVSASKNVLGTEEVLINNVVTGSMYYDAAIQTDRYYTYKLQFMDRFDNATPVMTTSFNTFIAVPETISLGSAFLNSAHQAPMTLDVPDAKKIHYAIVSPETKDGDIVWKNSRLNYFKNHSVTGLSLSHGKSYQLAVKTQNILGLWSKVFRSEPASLDTTPPKAPSVNLTSTVFSSKASILPSWTSVDPESGVSSFVYAVGTAPNQSDILGWKTLPVGTKWDLSTVDFEENKPYYFSVYAKNGAGLNSDVNVSRPFSIDNSSPHIDRILVNQSLVAPHDQRAGDLDISVELSRASDIKKFSMELFQVTNNVGTGDSTTSIFKLVPADLSTSPEKTIRGLVSHQLLKPNTSYYVSANATDSYGNSMQATSNMFLYTSSQDKIVAHILPYPNPFNPNHGHIKVKFQLLGQAEVDWQVHAINGDMLHSNQTTVITGQQEVTWDGRDRRGNTVANGIYLGFLQIKNIATGRQEKQVVKIVVMK